MPVAAAPMPTAVATAVAVAMPVAMPVPVLGLRFGATVGLRPNVAVEPEAGEPHVAARWPELGESDPAYPRLWIIRAEPLPVEVAVARQMPENLPPGKTRVKKRNQLETQSHTRARVPLAGADHTR